MSGRAGRRLVEAIRVPAHGAAKTRAGIAAGIRQVAQCWRAATGAAEVPARLAEAIPEVAHAAAAHPATGTAILRVRIKTNARPVAAGPPTGADSAKAVLVGRAGVATIPAILRV